MTVLQMKFNYGVANQESFTLTHKTENVLHVQCNKTLHQACSVTLQHWHWHYTAPFNLNWCNVINPKSTTLKFPSRRNQSLQKQLASNYLRLKWTELSWSQPVQWIIMPRLISPDYTFN